MIDVLVDVVFIEGGNVRKIRGDVEYIDKDFDFIRLKTLNNEYFINKRNIIKIIKKIGDKYEEG